MDARVVASKTCWIGIERKMLEISEELSWNELVENCQPSTPSKKVVESEKSWERDERNQKIVMDGEVVKNSVMCAKFDPTVVVDLYIFKICGWNNLQPSTENMLDENEPWLLRGITYRDVFSVTQYLEIHPESANQHMKKQTTAFCRSLLAFMNILEDTFFEKLR